MSRFSSPSSVEHAKVMIEAGATQLHGFLEIPPQAHGVVLFAHGSGSGRHSIRNQRVAEALRQRGMATLLFDLLTEEEESFDELTAHLRFDIPLLARRLRLATSWVLDDRELQGLPLGYFGASTGAAAALIAAAEETEHVHAVVSRGGRPDLARHALSRVAAPTLLIVGGNDLEVLALNRGAYSRLTGEKRLEIVPGASHLFEESGTLAEVSTLAGAWFSHYFSTHGRNP
jgi:putative phosphoribosyl transferase